MAIRITDIRQAGGTGHEHISVLWWTNPATGQDGNSTRASIVSWIENENGKAYTEDGQGNRADVLVVTPGARREISSDVRRRSLDRQPPRPAP